MKHLKFVAMLIGMTLLGLLLWPRTLWRRRGKRPLMQRRKLADEYEAMLSEPPEAA